MIEELKQLQIIKDPKEKWFYRTFGMIDIDSKDAKFATQNKDEEIVIVLRKHIVNNIPWILTAILLFILPFVLYLIFILYDHNMNGDALMQSGLIQGFNQVYLWPALFFYLLLIVSYAYFKFIHWYFDFFIITNQRYISIDFDILRGRTITDIPLTDIIDISERVLGFFPTIFNYGDIEFKTTSQKISLVEDVPQTTWIRDSLADLIMYIRHIKVVKSKENPIIDVVQEETGDEDNNKEKDKSGQGFIRHKKNNSIEPALITDIVGGFMAKKEKKKGGQLMKNNEINEP